MLTQKVNYVGLLQEAGVEVDVGSFLPLSEEAKLDITDETLTSMMKLITDKYNALDFREIEKSAGDYDRFRYKELLRSNANILRNIYANSDDEGAQKYRDVVDAIEVVAEWLSDNHRRIAPLYQSGNGIIQLMYTSMVAAIIYSTGILIANTIRLVTTEKDIECQVLYDEIPGTIKNVHIKNILAVRSDIDNCNKLLNVYEDLKRKSINESITVAAVLAGAKVALSTTVGKAVVAGLGLLILPRLLVLFREIIYSVYFMRTKVADMLEMQADLVRTNVESLEQSGRGSKRTIATQRKVVDSLQKWQRIISVNVDKVNSMVAKQKNQDSQKLKVSPTSKLAQGPDYFESGDLML